MGILRSSDRLRVLSSQSDPPRFLGENAIPDSVVHHFDPTELTLSDGDTVETWPDLEGSADLSAIGGPQYAASAINGMPAVEYDGVDDGHENTNISVTQPNFTVAVVQPIDPDNMDRVFSGSVSERQIIHAQPSFNNDWRIFAGDTFIGGSANATAGDPDIVGGLFDGANSEVRVNGGVEVTSDPGDNNIDGLRIGIDDDDDPAGEFYLGEALLLDSPSQSDITDAESYLADVWGITI